MLDLDAELNITQAAKAANVSRALVYDWIRRDRLQRNPRGLVRYGDVLDVEAETRRCSLPTAFKRKPQLIAA